MHVFKCFFIKVKKNMFLCFFFNFQINVFNIYDLGHIKKLDDDDDDDDWRISVKKKAASNYVRSRCGPENAECDCRSTDRSRISFLFVRCRYLSIFCILLLTN